MKNKNQLFSANTKRADIPAEHFNAIPLGVVEFAAGDKDTDGNKGTFALTLYDGKTHSHWYWGNMAFDLTGMKMLKKKNPVLWRHDRDEPVGVSDAASFDGKFIMTGKFLMASAKAAEIQSHAADGLLYESSLSVDSMGAVIEYVKEGETVECNGVKIKGPGTVFRKSTIREGSICLFGALNKCKTEVFKDFEIERKNKMNMDEFKAQHSDLYNELFARGVAEGKTEGEKAERDKFTHVLALVDGDKDLAIECYQADKSDVETLKAKNAKLAEQLKAAEAAKGTEDLSKTVGKLKLSDNKVDAAISEFSDDASKVKPKKAAENQTEKQLRETFADDSKLQVEFGDDKKGEDAYVAFMKSQKAGTSKIMGANGN